MLPVNEGRPGPAVATAGGIGAVVACCTVKVLVITGLVAGLSGAAVGGIGFGAGVFAAFATWLVVMLVRRRSTRRACATDAPTKDPALTSRGRQS